MYNVNVIYWKMVLVYLGEP